MRIISVSSVLCMALGLAQGCASTAAPQAQLATSRAAIRAADELGAGKVPKASLHLQMAREGCDKAEKLIADKKNDQAKYVLMRAESDAELSLMLAKESFAEKDAQEALDKIKGMQKSHAESSSVSH